MCFVHVRGHSDDNGNDRADTLVQWGNGAAPYARGREGAGEGESRLKGDGTEGAKAIEDQKKAKVKEKEKKNAEAIKAILLAQGVDCGSSLPDRSPGLKPGHSQARQAPQPLRLRTVLWSSLDNRHH